MKKNARHSIARAVFETLEGRACLSATVALQDGVLLVQADPHTASVMQVQYVNNQQSIHAYTNGAQATFPASQVQSIDIIGSNRDDNIYVDPSLALPAQIEGGAGNDVIKGGNGFDTIDGGAGDDVIYGHGIISTGSGNDTVWGSNLGDVIIAGNGDDLLIGGSGNDTLEGGSGHDTLIGGAGDDKLVAGTGNNALYGGTGNNTLVGGPGNDQLYAQGGSNLLEPYGSSNRVYAGPHDTVVPATTGPAALIQPGGNPPPNQVPPQPTDGTRALIQSLESTVIAGEGVEVNGLGSSLGTGNRATATYRWDFGDAGSKYDTLTGWNAGHVYDAPGVYTITLSVTDAAGQTSTATSQVTVAADMRPVIYVDTAGSDANTGASPAQAVKTAARAFQLATDDARIEFRRGETFDVNATLWIKGHDMYVGAYGTGANPVLMRGAGDGGVTIFLSGTATNTTVQGLTFDSPNAVTSGPAPKVDVFGVWAEGTNVVVRDNTFLNLDDAVNGSIRPTGVIVQDNNAPLLTGVRGYFNWVDGTNWTIVGNTVANSTREHIIRGSSMTTDSVLIAYNNLSNPTRSDDPDEVAKTTINFREGTDIYVYGNALNDGSVAFGPGPWVPDTDNVTWLVLNGNQVNNTQVYLAGAVHHAVVENNVLRGTGTSLISLRPDDPSYADRHMQDVTITRNTGINGGTLGQFLQVTDEDLPGVITVTDNLYVAPNLVTGANMSGAVLVTAPDLNDFALISGNVWPAGGTHAGGGVNYVGGTWFANDWLTPQQWNAQAVVGGDTFRNVTVPALTSGTGAYDVTVNGSTAGAAALPVPA